jgi:crossover junction endodeoxyribonuclease RuvC
MRVLAFDPGFERLGVAVVEKTKRGETLLYSDCVHTAKNLPFEKRLHLLGETAEDLIALWKPECVALEHVFFEKNAKTAINVAGVRGMLAYIAVSHKLPLYEYTPLEVKVAVTGYGKSDKRAVGEMVKRLVSIPAKKRLDDELDAIAIGLTCLASAKL